MTARCVYSPPMYTGRAGRPTYLGMQGGIYTMGCREAYPPWYTAGCTLSPMVHSRVHLSHLWYNPGASLTPVV